MSLHAQGAAQALCEGAQLWQGQLADALAACDVVFQGGVRQLEGSACRGGHAQACGQGAHHGGSAARHRPAQVDSRRAHGCDLPTALLEGSLESRLVCRALVEAPQGHGVGAGIPDGRRAAHGKLRDGVAHLPGKRAFQVGRLMRQPALVQQEEGAVFPVQRAGQLLKHGRVPFGVGVGGRHS